MRKLLFIYIRSIFSKNKKCIRKFLRYKVKLVEFHPMFLEFLKWKLIDGYRRRKGNEKLHLYEVRCVAGMYGQGKTMTMNYLAYNYKQMYKDKVLVFSNFGCGLQDAPLTIERLVAKYDRPAIFFYDEIQNDYPSSNKPIDDRIRKVLSLNRHGNGKRIYWCSQDHELVHKTIRRLTVKYADVRTLAKRYTRVRWYLKDAYEQLYSALDVKKKMKIKPVETTKFIQSDMLRGLYDSFSEDDREKLV